VICLAADALQQNEDAGESAKNCRRLRSENGGTAPEKLQFANLNVIPEINAAKHRSCAAYPNMYKQFFGLSENPFNVNPDPRYLYLTPNTREALDVLTYGIQTRKGLMLLTGEVGTGKTTLLNRLIDWLHQQKTPTAFIFNSHLEVSHLFDFILADFEVPFDSRFGDSALMRLTSWLVERYRAGDIPVLIVDEAQGLPIHVLEEIRMLLNLETPHEKLLQIVLSGQPELEERLKRHDLRQLKQRIMLRCKTAALTLEETRDYIQARLHIAGANCKSVFSSQAMDAVHVYSRGIPRVTNLLCEHALMNAYADHVQPVPVHIIEEIARKFQLDDIKPLAPSIDSEDSLGLAMIAPQPALANAVARPPAEARLHLQEKPGDMATCVSPPDNVADTLLSRAKELAPPVLDCETTPTLNESKVLDVPAAVQAPPEPSWIDAREPSTSTALDSDAAIKLSPEVVTKQVPISSSPLLNAANAKEKLDLLPISSRSRMVGPQKAVHRQTTANATTSTPVTSRRTRFLGPCLSLTHCSARWGKRFLSAVNSPLWKQEIATLVSRLQRPLQSVGALCRWLPAQRGGRQSVVGYRQWPRMMLSLHEWLRQPFDPMQLWRLPYSWRFKMRLKLSHKSK
jgi:general secretion pathway protein A